MRIFLAILLFSATAYAADTPVYLIDKEELDLAGEKALLVDVVKEHFGDTLNLAAAQKMYCSKGKKTNEDGSQVAFNSCTMVEQGTCTKAQFAAAYLAGAKVSVISIDGDTVTYRRQWEPAEITVGDRQSSVVAYLNTVHPDITLQFLTDFVAFRSGETIQSRAVYLSVVDDSTLADLSLNGTLLKAAPQQ